MTEPAKPLSRWSGRAYPPAPPALLDFVRALARALARQHHAEEQAESKGEAADAA